MDEELDHVADRVRGAAALGSLAGGMIAVYRGYPFLRTMGYAGFSCAMVATATFGCERLAGVAMESNDTIRNNLSRLQFLVLSHVTGGAIGGAIVGGLYQQQPLNGMVLLVPLMTVWGVGESMFQDLRDFKMEQSLKAQGIRDSEKRH